jgi:nicotinamide mononucleotide transporter PnuC
MKYRNPIKCLTKFEKILWAVSVIVVAASFLLTEPRDYLTLAASVIGVSALIFVAKGMVIGQLICVFFAIFYGIISFNFRYYGEMITYLCMTAPIAVMAVVSWIRNPYKGTKEVKVSHITKKQLITMSVFAVVVTIAFYFILKAIGNANLFFSTVSITTSFVASYLTFLRSPYYALAYSANDIVLIVLWTLATLENLSYLPMILCFVMFLANDIYGYINWKRMRNRQEKC